MHTIIICSIVILISIAVLTYSANIFINGAAAIARNLGLSTLLVGLTIVALGTSLPEVLVSVMAAIQGNTGLAIGNAIGSNTANIGLVLGISALIAPLTLNSFTLQREFPVLILITLFSGTLLLDNHLSRIDGVMLLLGMVGLLIWLVWLSSKQESHADPMIGEFEAEIPTNVNNKKALIQFGIGMILLAVSSRVLVTSAVVLAHHAGISDMTIGLTIVAIGTSLPELVTSLLSAIKGEHDIAIGNIIGSNMFNLLAVLGLPGVIHPEVIDAHVLSRDYLMMLTLTLLLYAIIYLFGKKRQVNRFMGALMLAGYFAYLTIIIYTS